MNTCPNCHTELASDAAFCSECGTNIQNKRIISNVVTNEKSIEKKYCRNCGNSINEKAVVCTSCGLPPLLEKSFCQDCGVKTNSKQVICISCGVSLVNQKDNREINNINSNGNLYSGIYRSSDDKVFFGFCGGLAHKFGMQPSLVRIITLISGFFVIGWIYLAGPFFPKYPTKNI